MVEEIKKQWSSIMQRVLFFSSKTHVMLMC